jgi:hypothetical protein
MIFQVKKPGGWTWHAYYSAESLKAKVNSGEVGLDWKASRDNAPSDMTVGQLLQQLEGEYTTTPAPAPGTPCGGSTEQTGGAAPYTITSKSNSVWCTPITMKNRPLLGFLGAVCLIGGAVWLYFLAPGLLKNLADTFGQLAKIDNNHPMGLVAGLIFAFTIFAIHNVIVFFIMVFPGICIFMLGVNMLRGLMSPEPPTQSENSKSE